MATTALPPAAGTAATTGIVPAGQGRDRRAPRDRRPRRSIAPGEEPAPDEADAGDASAPPRERRLDVLA